MKLNDFLKICLNLQVDYFSLITAVWKLQIHGKEKFNLKFHMHYAHLVLKNKAEFILLETKQDQRSQKLTLREPKVTKKYQKVPNLSSVQNKSCNIQKNYQRSRAKAFSRSLNLT